MHLSDTGLALIRQFEGYRALLYRDAAGLPTIGYGHLVTPRERAYFTTAITPNEALTLLGTDVAVAEAAVNRLITTALTQHQFDALVCFTFNLGAAVLQRSTLRRVVNRGDHAHAPAQFLRYVWAGGRKQPGLQRRRQAEAALYRL